MNKPELVVVRACRWDGSGPAGALILQLDVSLAREKGPCNECGKPLQEHGEMIVEYIERICPQQWLLLDEDSEGVLPIQPVKTVQELRREVLQEALDAARRISDRASEEAYAHASVGAPDEQVAYYHGAESVAEEIVDAIRRLMEET